MTTDFINPSWCFTYKSTVAHLVGDYDKVLVAACGFVPVLCPKCVKAQQLKIKQLQKDD